MRKDRNNILFFFAPYIKSRTLVQLLKKLKKSQNGKTTTNKKRNIIVA